MIQKAKKKTSFLIGILATGILSVIGGYISSNYSRDGSFLTPIAKADVPNPLSGTGFEGTSASIDAGSGGGDGGGGGGGDCSSSSCY